MIRMDSFNFFATKKEIFGVLFQKLHGLPKISDIQFILSTCNKF